MSQVQNSGQQNQALAVVFMSENGRDNWRPIPQSQVPEFVKRPDVMGRLLDGEECMDAAQGAAGSAWYRAQRIEAS